MAVSSFPPHPWITPWDIVHKTELAQWHLDPKPVYHKSTKPRQLVGRVFRHFVKDSFYTREGKRTLESGTCSWCDRRFDDKREFFEHGACRSEDDDSSPTMRQARIWMGETEEELNQLKRGARAARLADLDIREQILRKKAARMDDNLQKLERAKEKLKQDVQDTKKQEFKSLYESYFQRNYKFRSLQGRGMTRQPTNRHCDRYLAWVVRGVEEGASRLMGKRCRIPLVHR